MYDNLIRDWALSCALIVNALMSFACYALISFSSLHFVVFSHFTTAAAGTLNLSDSG